MAHDPHLMKNLLALKKRSFDVKFDLAGTGYTSLENIGSGAYGVVCCARHDASNEKVAIKKIPNIFDLSTTAKRTYREIKILRHFKHDNTISIREILQVKDRATYKDVYVVLDLMESDLHRIIHSNQQLTEEHVRYFIYQILRGLKYIHSANIIHRDLKPSNILVNENCLLKIGDFGMARGVSENGGDLHQHKQCMTQYVATRWYRAPELIMLFDDYTEAVDLWSTGCILAEMLGRKQIFPAKDVLSQLQMIVMTLGTPPNYLLRRSQSDIVRGLVLSIKVCEKPVPLSQRYPKSSKKAIDLLTGLLVLDPEKRLTAQQALKHLFVNKYHDPNDEPTCEKFDFSFENEALTCDQLRTVIWEEIKSFHNDTRRERKTDSRQSSETIQPADQPIQFLVQPENVFKVPHPNQHHVAPQPSHLFASSDIEMLSAKSTADTEMMEAGMNGAILLVKPSTVSHSTSTAHSTDLHDSNIPNVHQPSDTAISQQDARHRPDLTVTTVKPPPQANRTISEDTKALIKAALLQSTNRRKMGETSDSQVKKPVTAQQRQKEREERRRKKNEKSKRKPKEKPEPTLSVEDKNILERWQNMAPAPKEPAKPSPTEVPSIPTQNANTIATNPVFQGGNPILVNQAAVSFMEGNESTIIIQAPMAGASTFVATTQAAPTNNETFVNPFIQQQIQLQQHHQQQQNISFQQNQDQIAQLISNQLAQTFPPEEQHNGNLHQPSVPIQNFAQQQVQPLRFVSPPKSENSPTLSFVNAAPKRSWSEMPLQASPATEQAFIQTHSLLDQLNQISEPPKEVKPADRDPLLGQSSTSGLNDRIQNGETVLPRVPVICIDETSNDQANGGVQLTSTSQQDSTMSDVTKQFSRSHVDDLFPPNLVSTPKGGGEGYGVGLDMDEILQEWIVSNKGHDVTPGSAPLSASTLTDWLQVAGNVDPRDMADLQRELDLSPMVTTD